MKSATKTTKVSKKNHARTEELLRNTLEALQTSNKKSIDKDVQEAIHYAVHSGDNELYGLGVSVAFESMRPFLWGKIKKALANQHNNEADDYYNTIYLMLWEKLPEYNPKWTLLTYFERLITPALMNEHYKGTGTELSRHYQQRAVWIQNARRELAEMGYDNPSKFDICKQVQKERGVEISPRLIDQIDSMTAATLSIDDNISYHRAPEETQPEVVILRKEQQDDFRRLITRLPRRYRKLIEYELEYHDIYGDLPPIADLFEALKDQYTDGFTMEHAQRMRKAAYRELRSMYLSKKKREVAFSGYSSKSEVVQYNLQTDEEDFTASLLDETMGSILDKRKNKTKTEKKKAEVNYAYVGSSARVISVSTGNKAAKSRSKKKDDNPEKTYNAVTA